MANVWYWDIINGDDGNDGTAIADAGGGVGPVRTLTRAHAIASNGDRIIIGPGIYPSSVLSGASSFDVTKTLMFTPQKAGKVIFDFEGQLPSAGHITFSGGSGNKVFKGIQFRNMGVGKYALYRSGGAGLYVEDCVFEQRDGGANTGRGVRGSATVEYCSFYNLEEGCNNFVAVRGCYFKSVTTAYAGSSSGDYNGFPGNTETNGINTSTGIDPGFVDAAAGDFRLALDPTGYAEEYLTMGEFGGSIGASGASGPWWDARFPQSRWMVPDPTPGDGMVGVWQNDADYDDPGGSSFTGTIVEDSGDYEPIIDLSANPSALSGRLLSPVIDWGTDSVTLEHAPIAAFRDPGAGAEIDTDTAYPAKAEYRQSSTSFLWDDPESTDLVWVEFELHEKINLTSRYQQFRVTFQVAHTGA